MPEPLPPERPTSRLKLALLGAIGVAMVVLPLTQVLRYQGAELQSALVEHAGLDPVARAVEVQQGLIAHRDVAGRVLRGNVALEAERLSRQGEVDERIARLAGALVVVTTERAVEESNALREDWALLARQVRERGITAPESDLGHRLLIEQTLQVIDLVADASLLGRDRDPGTALLASLTARSLPRLAAEIAALAPPGGAPGQRADERQMVATEAALARSLGRLNESIERSEQPQPKLAAAVAEAGAAADRYFDLLRRQPGADPAPAGRDAVQAQFRLLDAARDALAASLNRRVTEARGTRDLTVATMSVLALLALGLAFRLLVPQPRRLPDPALPTGEQGGPGAVPGAAMHAAGGSSRDEAGRLLQRLRGAPARSGGRAARTPAQTLPPELR